MNSSNDLTRRSVLASIAGVSAAVSLPRWAMAADAPPKDPVLFKAGNYFYLSGGPTAPFSGGVAPEDGYYLTRVRLKGTPVLAEGLKRAVEWMKSQKRPLSALAACELRSATPLGRAEFAASNDEYNALLRAHGFGSDSERPIARSNMALSYQPPSEKCLYAFTYTTPIEKGMAKKSGDFVISGSTPRPPKPDAAPAMMMSEDPAATLKGKTASTLDVLREKVVQLGCKWEDINGAQIYTTLTLDAAIEVLNAQGLGHVGLDLFPGHPPGAAQDFEMDIRAISVEREI